MPFETGPNANPHINSARMVDFNGQLVRLLCKVLEVNAGTAVVQACDDGQITVNKTTELSVGGFYDIVGRVADATTLTQVIALPMGQEMDMKLVNDAINITFDERFKTLYFRNP